MPTSPVPPVTPHEVERLAFVRYLLELGNAQAGQPDPLSAVAVLMWHDALDLFMQVAATHTGANAKGKESLLQYFEPINQALEPAQLPHRASIGQLSAARDTFKHHGLAPRSSDMKGFERTVNNFFVNATPLVFGIPIEQASLIGFVRSEAAREELKVAGQALESEDLHGGLTSCAKAFQHVIDDYEARVQKRFSKSTFVGGSFHVTAAQRRLARIRHVGNPEYREPDYDLRAGLNALSLGLDHRSYIRFRLLTPDRVSSQVTGRRVDKWFFPSKAPPPSEADVQFCIDFVVESALRVQEFSFVYQEEERDA